MFNIFRKHNDRHYDIDDALTVLSIAVLELQELVNELREELDFLIDELDD